MAQVEQFWEGGGQRRVGVGEPFPRRRRVLAGLRGPRPGQERGPGVRDRPRRHPAHEDGRRARHHRDHRRAAADLLDRRRTPGPKTAGPSAPAGGRLGEETSPPTPSPPQWRGASGGAASSPSPCRSGGRGLGGLSRLSALFQNRSFPGGSPPGRVNRQREYKMNRRPYQPNQPRTFEEAIGETMARHGLSRRAFVGGGAALAGAAAFGAGRPRNVGAQEVELVFTYWGSPQEQEAVAQMCESFNGEHPNITVRPQYVPNEGYTEKMTTMLAGGTPPYIAYMDAEQAFDWALQGKTLDLA